VSTKPLVITAHARLRLRERNLRSEWIELAVRDPDWREPDLSDKSVERRFRAIPAFGNRILRVACVETNASIRIISVLFDRNARRKP
jgi:uncharacterized DUF497 family protein